MDGPPPHRQHPNGPGHLPRQYQMSPERNGGGRGGRGGRDDRGPPMRRRGMRYGVVMDHLYSSFYY